MAESQAPSKRHEEGNSIATSSAPRSEGKSLAEKILEIVRKRKLAEESGDGDHSIVALDEMRKSGSQRVHRFSQSLDSILQSLGVVTNQSPLSWLPVDKTWGSRAHVKVVLPPQVLRSSLFTYAEAVADSDETRINALKPILERETTLDGNPIQRVGAIFLEAIDARIHGTGSGCGLQPLQLNRSEQMALLGFSGQFCAVGLCVEGIGATLVQSLEGYSKVHIIDFGLWLDQWPYFMQMIAHRKGGPPAMRFTVVEPPRGAPQGIGPAIPAIALEQQVRGVARACGIAVTWKVVVSRVEDLSAELLGVNTNERDKEEALVINCGLRLSLVPDGDPWTGAQRHKMSQRDAVLRLLRDLNPVVVTQAELNMETTKPFFLPRFRETFDLFSLIFDSVSDLPGIEKFRKVFESQPMRRHIINLVSCEGSDRVARHERVDSWQKRMWRQGMLPKPLSDGVKGVALRYAQKHVHGADMIVVTSRQGVVELKYRGHSLCCFMAWQPFPRASDS